MGAAKTSYEGLVGGWLAGLRRRCQRGREREGERKSAAVAVVRLLMIVVVMFDVVVGEVVVVIVVVVVVIIVIIEGAGDSGVHVQNWTRLTGVLLTLT